MKDAALGMQEDGGGYGTLADNIMHKMLELWQNTKKSGVQSEQHLYCSENSVDGMYLPCFLAMFNSALCEQFHWFDFIYSHFSFF